MAKVGGIRSQRAVEGLSPSAPTPVGSAGRFGIDVIEATPGVQAGNSVSRQPRIPEAGPSERVRARSLGESGEIDEVVVGAGMTGAGVARELAAQGRKVLLLDAADIASATSRNSSKLAHGGVRYVEKGDLGLVSEGLKERGRMFELFPHLVKPEKFAYVLNGRKERILGPLGLTAYDAFAKWAARKVGGSVPWHKMLSPKELQEIAPALDGSIKHVLQYYDGKIVDDARLNINVVRDAVAHGAAVGTRMKVEGYLQEGGRVVGVKVRDLELDPSDPRAVFDVRAKNVINAGGVWTEDLQKLSNGAGELKVKASKGVHILLPKDAIRADTSFLVRTKTSVLFLIRHGDHWICGTTDTPYHFDKVVPTATRQDIDYLLEQVNGVLKKKGSADAIRHEDIVSTYAGLRPLVQAEPSKASKLLRKITGKREGGEGATAKLSRNHVIKSRPGLFEMAGGKITNFRMMAEHMGQAVRKASGLPPMKSPTRDARLVGADAYESMVEHADAISQNFGVEKDELLRLLNRYGDNALTILEDMRSHPETRERISGTQYTLAEARFGASHELALHLDDLLDARTRVSLESKDRGAGDAGKVARAVAPILNWDEQAISREVAGYRRRVAQQLRAEQQPSDEAAAQVMAESAA